jgi:putative transposase
MAWHAATIKDVSMVTTPLRMALWHRAHDGRPVKAPELSHHSDAGSQYASIRLTERLSWEHVVASIGSVGGAYENAQIESANDIYRAEGIRTTILSRQPVQDERRRRVRDSAWVDWYNCSRLHSSIGLVQPSALQKSTSPVRTQENRPSSASSLTRSRRPHDHRADSVVKSVSIFSRGFRSVAARDVSW